MLHSLITVFFCGREVDLVIRGLLPVLQCMPRKGKQANEENHESFQAG